MTRGSFYNGDSDDETDGETADTCQSTTSEWWEEKAREKEKKKGNAVGNAARCPVHILLAVPCAPPSKPLPLKGGSCHGSKRERWETQKNDVVT